MNAADASLIRDELNMSRDELLEVLIKIRREQLCNEGYRIENKKALEEMSKDYRKLKKINSELLEENKKLREKLSSLIEKEQLKTRTIFGRGTEKFGDLINSDPTKEEIDEAEAEIIDFPQKKSSWLPVKHQSQRIKQTKKTKGKRATLLDSLPQELCFYFEPDMLDEKFGKDVWCIVSWHKHRRVEVIPKSFYVINEYTPVIKSGGMLYTIQNPYTLLKYSIVTASLMADILYQKFSLFVTTYRLEREFNEFGLDLSRQTINNWIINLSLGILGPLYDYLNKKLLEIPYHQCDETTLEIIRDGRKPGSKSYIWIHCTSQLLDVPPIVVFCYELTRSTDHLRKFYKDFEGFITCDAYISYHVLGKEKFGIVIICGCMMHARRRYALSLELIDKSRLSEEELEELPEVRVLRLIGEIYDADEGLKNLPCEERLEKRKTGVKPLVDKYYEYISTIDTDDPLIRARLKDAVTYSLNQKEFLCRFLEDGNIPVDNGECERYARDFAIGRRNFLFCNSMDGAQACSIAYTIIETAKANKTNIYLYLKYILELMPAYMNSESPDECFLDAMLPWSEEYKSYEKTCMSGTPPDKDYYHKEKPIITIEAPSETSIGTTA